MVFPSWWHQLGFLVPGFWSAESLPYMHNNYISWSF
jgi:hypothetical protein